MTLTLSRKSKESTVTKALREVEQLKFKIQLLEQQHQEYVRSQQDLISAIAEICMSSIQEVEALRILIYKGEAECRRYLRSLLVNQRKVG
jgi:CII-binding regulator of phage lambda lysogenization HflD